jgi:hypothetical protein
VFSALSHLAPTEEELTDRKKSKSLKRKAASDQLNELREELFAGEFDGYA